MKEISETELNSPESPGDGWYIIEAAGQHPHGELMQNLTPAVLARVAAAGVPPEGLPVDKDHLSYHEDKTTEAMGWVRELALCGGNLAARIEWTPPGLALVAGKVYKHFSTVYPGAAEGCTVYEPERLIGLALTNQPNNAAGQPPITNSKAVQGGSRKVEVGSENSAPPAPSSILPTSNFQPPTSSSAPPAEADPAACSGYTLEDAAEMGLLKKNTPENFPPPPHGAEAEPQNQTNTQTMQYNPELLALLGLADGATDEEVLTAVRALKEGADAAAEAEAEALVNSEEAKEGVELSEEEKKECRDEVVTNRARGLRFTSMLCQNKRLSKAPAAGAVTNRYAGAGRTPALTNRKSPQAAEQAICNRANEIIAERARNGQKMSWWTAVSQARLETPNK